MIGGEVLTDGVIALRRIEAEDTPLLYAWRNDASARAMFRDSRPLHPDSHKRFVQAYLEGASGDYWWIAEAAQGPVGTISLYHFSDDRRACEFGRFVIGAEHRGHGFGRRALALAMSVARSLEVERMLCEVLSTNEHALSLYGGMGFSVKRIEEAGTRSFVWMEAELNKI